MNVGAEPELAVEGLTIKFGGLTAVDGATFEVRTGEVLSLIGPNGAGKTTAFNAITGYVELSGGDIRYRARRLNGLKPNEIAALGVVRTFQKTSVFAGRSVHENVAIGLHLRSRQTALAILQSRLTASVVLIEALGGGWTAADLPSHDQIRSDSNTSVPLP